MTSFMRMACLGFAACFSSAANAQTFNLDKAKPAIEKAIRAELAKGSASVSLALVQGGRIVWSAAYGFSNATTQTPATTATIYSTGSTAKSIAAVAVMQLVEQGKIELDAPVNRYLRTARVKDRLQVDEAVTIRQLLTHSSGLTCDVRVTPVFSRTLPPSLADMTARAYTVRKPKDKYEYCNVGYGVLGYVVEQVSGVEYEKYLVDNILKPVGVETPAPIRPTARMADLLAQPYVPKDGKPQPVDRMFYDVYPAGDLYMTPTDMAKYLGMQLNNGTFNGKRILTEASMNEIHRDQSVTKEFPYGFGLIVNKGTDGHTIISHTGGTPGFTTYMIGDMDLKVGAYVMTNSSSPNRPLEIGRAALDQLRGSVLKLTTEP